MANLIIKSSADNLVLQGSDDSPAITVGATGTTTFAENVTMSGTANALGTVTAGTIGSAVTFPAGHVVKVERFENNTRTGLTTSTSRSTIWTVVFNKLISTSNLLIQWHLSAWGSSADTTLWECYAGSGSWTRGPMAYDQDTSGTTKFCILDFLLTDCDATGSQNIGLGFHSSNSSSNKPFNVWNPNTTEDVRNSQELSTCIVTEITT